MAKTKFQNNPENSEYDYIVIGSGFGGSVSALRLAEKGYRVGVLEKGREWKTKDFPKTNWNIRKYFKQSFRYRSKTEKCIYRRNSKTF